MTLLPLLSGNLFFKIKYQLENALREPPQFNDELKQS